MGACYSPRNIPDGASRSNIQQRVYRSPLQACTLSETKHKVHILHRLPSSTLNQVIDAANDMDVKVVVTHPFGSFVNASIEEQKEMVRKGAYLENSWIITLPMHQQINPIKYAEIIKEVGAQQCILSSDFGQDLDPSYNEVWINCISSMLRLGISESDIQTMVRDNPTNLLGL